MDLSEVHTGAYRLRIKLYNIVMRTILGDHVAEIRLAEKLISF